MDIAQERMEQRKADFKRGIDGDESRRRREDTQVSIRKNKRDEMLAKRRQDVTPAPQAAAGPTAVASALVDSDLQAMVAKLNGNNFEIVLDGTTQIRKLLSLEKNPPIQRVIDAGVVPQLLRYCTASGYPKLQYEAAWALTNIASGTTAQTKVVVDAGSVPVFVQLLQSPEETVREQAIWALGNIAGDSPAHRDAVLRANALPGLELNIKNTTKISLIRNATWTLSNLARGKPQPEVALVAPMFPLLAGLLCSTDEEVLTDACWALSYLTDGDEKKVSALLSLNVMSRVVELMGYANVSIQTPALRTVGNVATGNEQQTDAIIRAGAVPQLAKMLHSSRKAIRKEAMWTLSNITAGTAAQIQAVRDCGSCVVDIVRLLETAEWEIKKEAAWTVANYCSGGTREQVRFLVLKGKVVKPICDLLASSDTKITLVALDAVRHILSAGAPDGSDKSSINPFLELVEDADGLDKIENLQNHENAKIYEKSVRIIEQFFGEEEGENGGMAPMMSNMQGGGFSFEPAFAQQQQGMFNSQNQGWPQQASGFGAAPTAFTF